MCKGVCIQIAFVSTIRSSWNLCPNIIVIKAVDPKVHLWMQQPFSVPRRAVLYHVLEYCAKMERFYCACARAGNVGILKNLAILALCEFLCKHLHNCATRCFPFTRSALRFVACD